MIESAYEPGDEPDVCEAHGRELPRWECRAIADDQYADWKHYERKERT